MKRSHLYLLLCLLGLVLPYSQFLPFLIQEGFNFSEILNQAFANRVSSFFVLGLVVSAIVLIVFIVEDGNRKRIRPLWIPVIATLVVGVSLGFPLYLYLKQLKRER